MAWRMGSLIPYFLFVSIPVWTLMILILTPLYILGWILVPIATASGAYVSSIEKSIYGEYRLVYHFTWPFMYIWDNWEDGICAGQQYKELASKARQIIYWTCFRNPVNNHRAVPYLSCKIDPKKVKFYGTDTNYFAYQGMYSNLYQEFKLFKWKFRFWIGHKISRADTVKVSAYKSRGAGFALQLKGID
jgi:hypothetical protein